MACSTKSGPQAYLKGIEDITGVKVSQDQYHALRELAYRDIVAEEYHAARKRGDFDSNTKDEYDAIRERGRAVAREKTGRTRVSGPEKVFAASALGDRLAEDSGDAGGYADVRVRMQTEAAENSVTAGTVAVANLITANGLKVALRRANGLIASQKRAMRDKARVAAAADEESDPRMAEGLRKAAAMMTKDGDAEVSRWLHSGDMEREYPGLSDVYYECKSGPQAARKFSMYSYEGNVAADAAASETERRMEREAAKGREWTSEDMRAEFDAIQGRLEKKFPEIRDTEPRVEMAERLTEKARALGWSDASWAFEMGARPEDDAS